MKIIILGNGAEVPNIIELIAFRPDLSISGILDDNPLRPFTRDLPVIGNLSEITRYADHGLVWGINSMNNRFLRLRLAFELQLSPERFVRLIHPSAIISPSAELGSGVIVQAGTVISCNVKIGNHTYISPLCSIGHDTTLADGNILASGVMLAGGVKIGAANYFGMTSGIREKLVIENGNIIGMGATVIHNVTNGHTMVGVPAHSKGQQPLPELFSAWISSQR